MKSTRESLRNSQGVYYEVREFFERYLKGKVKTKNARDIY
jgi:hypothetical protein